MKILPLKTLSLLGSALLVAQGSYGAALFSDDFDLNSTANWTVNASAGTHPVNIFFDYSSIGIPTAPNSTGGSTYGVKMQGNTAGSVFGGVSISPTGQSFTGDYSVRYDLWMNYNGPLGTGGTSTPPGNGTTQFAGVGIGTAGTSAQWAGGVQDSLHFGMAVDGGSTQDYRVYPKGTLAAQTTGYYAAGTGGATDTRNDTHSYYFSLGQKTAPAAQTLLYPQQTGTTRIGSVGFAWRDVEVVKIGDTVTWSIDGLLIATVTNTTSLSLAGNNILLNYYDSNSGSSTDPNAGALLFGLVDNLRVTSIVPEPAAAALAIVGAGLIGFMRRRK